MVEETSDFRASIAELQAVLLGTESIDRFLQEVAVLAARQLGQGLSCGITLQPNGRPLTVASSDVNAAQIDELQYGLDHGPCLTALRTGEQIRIDDLASDRRWGDYAVRALAHGARSSLSMPLTVPDGPVGALNLYSDQPRFFGQPQTRLAERFAQDASVAVGIAARLAAQSVLAGQLRASLASRAVIDQAIGVIMAQRCTATDAFDVLRSASQNRNVKLRPGRRADHHRPHRTPPAATPLQPLTRDNHQASSYESAAAPGKREYPPRPRRRSNRNSPNPPFAAWGPWMLWVKGCARNLGPRARYRLTGEELASAMMASAAAAQPSRWLPPASRLLWVPGQRPAQLSC